MRFDLFNQIIFSHQLTDTIRYLSLHDNKYIRYYQGHDKKLVQV